MKRYKVEAIVIERSVHAFVEAVSSEEARGIVNMWSIDDDRWLYNEEQSCFDIEGIHQVDAEGRYLRKGKKQEWRKKHAEEAIKKLDEMLDKPWNRRTAQAVLQQKQKKEVLEVSVDDVYEGQEFLLNVQALKMAMKRIWAAPNYDPIKVRLNVSAAISSGKKKYVVVDGAIKFRAIKELGWKTVVVEVQR
jgi:hypothetical protein